MASSSYMPFEETGQNRGILVQQYFALGFTYLEILGYLHLYHGISISIRQLNRILRSFGLHRKPEKVDWSGVLDGMEAQLSSSGRETAICISYIQYSGLF